MATGSPARVALLLPSVWLLDIISAWRAAASDGEADEGGVDRVEWRYIDKSEAITIYALGERRRTAERSDGKKPNYVEVGRTEEYGERQNEDTKLLVRLHADRGYWRRPKDESGTRWFKGEWVEEPMGVAPPVVDPVIPNEPLANHSIRLVYFVPQDRKPTAEFQKEIGVVASVVAEPSAQFVEPPVI